LLLQKKLGCFGDKIALDYCYLRAHPSIGASQLKNILIAVALTYC